MHIGVFLLCCAAMNIKSLALPGTEQLLEWGPKLASALLVVATAYMLTQLVWLLTGNTGTEFSSSPTGSAIKADSSRTQAAKFANNVAALHLFGHTDAQPVDEGIDAPETKLNLKLLGILSIGEKSGLAIITGAGQAEKVYKVGDRVPGNVILKAVYADRVLLESSRGLETLPLPKQADLVKFSESSQTNSAKQAYQPTETPKITPRLLNNYRKQLSRNPAEIQKMAKVSTAREGDKVIGYKLQPGTNAAMYRALGLKDGDVVTSVNGIDLTKPENSIRALQKLRRAKHINATILRDGQEIQINHSLGR